MDTSPDLGKKRGNPDEPEPAIEGKRDRISYEDVDLTKYIETRYVSKNKNLKRILAPLESGDLPDKFIEIIEPLIRSNDWRGFDSFCETHKGVDHFWDILQCLFYLNYFAAEKIDFDQMQKAMGIQQARWSFDPANECYQELRKYNKKHGPPRFGKVFDYFLENIIRFTYFNDFDIDSQNRIVNEFLKNAIDLDLYYDKDIKKKIKSEIKSALNNKIFYEFEYNESNALLLSESEFGEVWNFNHSYLGIPQTYDLTSVTCFHKPILIFGSIKPKTMVNFIIKHNMRPFAAHLPGSTSNLTVFDENLGSLVNNWRHDLAHQLDNQKCDVGETIKRANNICPSEGELPGEDASSEDWLNNERFQTCLDSKRTIKMPGQSDYVAESFLDDGDIFKKYQRKNYLLGGKKTNRRRNRKTRGKKQKRSRKHP
jgi:hypothetical protein